MQPGVEISGSISRPSAEVVPRERLRRKSFSMHFAKNQFTKYGFFGCTILDEHRSTSTTNAYSYQLQPAGLGRFISTRQKLSLLLGDQRELLVDTGKGEIRLHPMVEYLLEKQIRYDFVRDPVKQTEYEVRLIGEWEVRKDSDEFKRKLKSFVQNSIINIKDVTPPRDNLKEEQLRKYHQGIRQRRVFYQNYFEQLLKNNKIRIPCGHSQTTDKIKFSKVLWDNIDALETINIQDQLTKLRAFRNKYKDFYGANLDNKKDGTKHIIVKKYCQEIDSVLHTVEDHVFHREKTSKNRENSVVLIKDIFSELESYFSKVSKDKNKQFYHYVSPSNVLFNQFTLKPKLKFDPMLNDVLGLRKRPLTVENLVTFFPTPRHFDFFQSELELDEEKAVILEDPCYGVMELAGEDNKMREAINKERKKLDSLRETITVERFLLTSYFILNGKAFGEDNKIKELEDMKGRFRERLKQQKVDIQKNPAVLSKFVGYERKKEPSLKEFQFEFLQMMDYLDLVKEDHLITQNKYQKIKIFRNMRNLMLRELIKIFTSDRVFHKIFNVKKYMCMYALLAFELVDTLSFIFEEEERREGERTNLCAMFQKEIKKVRSGKNYHEFLKSTFEKIEGYRERDPQRDAQSKYINIDQQGSKSLKDIKGLKEAVDEMMKPFEKLNKYDRRLEEDLTEDMVNELIDRKKWRTQQLKEALREENSRIKQACMNLVFKEVQPPPEGAHKLARKQNQSEQQFANRKRSFDLFTKRTLTIMKGFFQISPQSLYNYEALIIPFLEIQDQERSIEVKIFDQEQAQKQNENLDMINSIIEMEKQKNVNNQQGFLQIYGQKQLSSCRTVLSKEFLKQSQATSVNNFVKCE